MIDFSKQKFNIICSDCNQQVEVTIQQVADEEIIECRCGKIIKLQDKDNSAKEAIGKLNQAFDDLHKTFKTLGK